MRFVAARVRGGHVELDEQVDLPDGAEVLVGIPDAVDEPVELDPDETTELEAALAASETARSYSVEEVMEHLRKVRLGEELSRGTSRSDR